MTRVTSAPRFVVTSFLGIALGLAASCGGSGSQAGKGPGLEVDYVGTWQTPPAVPSAAARATAAERQAALRNPAARSVAITGATVLTATGRRYAPGLVVLEGGAITYVGPAAGHAPPAGATIIDGRG